MKDDAGMLRIAIATLALTMIVVPVLALGLAPAHKTGLAQRAAVIVSQDKAIALAKAQGVARVANIAFEDGVWIVQGAARDGGHLEVDISSAGEVLNPGY